MVYWMEACMNKNSYNRNLKTKKDLYSPLFIVDFFERPYSHSVTLLTSVGNKEQIQFIDFNAPQKLSDSGATKRFALVVQSRSSGG